MGPVELAEAWSLQKGLQIACTLNIKKIEVETDSQEVNSLMTQNFNDLYLLAVIISNCRLLLPSFKEIKIFKISRTQNTCADMMAKEARKKLLPLRTYIDFVNDAYVMDFIRW